MGIKREKYPRNGVNFKFKRPQVPSQDKAVWQCLQAMRGLKNIEIWRKSCISPSTISAIRTRRTRYPRNLTVDTILEACGRTRVTMTTEEAAAWKRHHDT